MSHFLLLQAITFSLFCCRGWHVSRDTWTALHHQFYDLISRLSTLITLLRTLVSIMYLVQVQCLIEIEP